MQVTNTPYPNLIVKDYLGQDKFNELVSQISFDEIKKYGTNPDNPEYDPSDKPNYSIPVEHTKNLKYLLQDFGNTNLFSILTLALYKKDLVPDHNYVNIHYDTKGSSLDVHNDQKKYRWLITGQLYLDGDANDGVVLQDEALHDITKVPLQPNLLYAIATSMYSWHYVNPTVKDKISVLFRFGKKQLNTITNYDKNKNYCIIIDNSGHYDSHYAKLGMRMSKITESWLYDQGYNNILMSDWRDSMSLEYQIDRSKQNFDNVIVIPSGYLGEQDLLTQEIDPVNVFKITEDNIQDCADYVFHKKSDSTIFCKAEKIMLSNYKNMDWSNYE